MHSHRAFTLIELLVVIGIIGILVGIMLTSFGGGTESARAAKCLSNMRNLAQGAITYAVRKEGEFPSAGSYASSKMEDPSTFKLGTVYVQVKGWISWLSMNEYKEKCREVIECANINACNANETESMFAITNGAIWKFVGQNLGSYVCPEHERLARKHKAKARFSYVMSAAFGYDQNPGEVGHSGEKFGLSGSRLRADRRLMFAEVPFGEEKKGVDNKSASWDTANTAMPGDKAYETGKGNILLDCVLQYKTTGLGWAENHYNYNDLNVPNWGGTAESIAFNHKSGKKWCAHVVFADGHTEKLVLSDGSGISANALTAYLCEGVAVNFDGKGYSMPHGADQHLK